MDEIRGAEGQMDRDNGYERQSLLGGESIVYTRGSSKIYANRFGVTIEATHVKSTDELNQLAGIIALAWKDHSKLVLKTARVIQ